MYSLLKTHIKIKQQETNYRAPTNLDAVCCVFVLISNPLVRGLNEVVLIQEYICIHCRPSQNDVIEIVLQSAYQHEHKKE